MELQLIGANLLQLSDKTVNLLVDPYLYGQKLPTSLFKSKPIILLTQEWPEAKLPDDAFVIDSPGEYEVSGLSIKGVAVQLHVDTAEQPKRGVMYRVVSTDYNFGFIGHIAPKLSDEQQEELGLLDILCLPVGGNGYTMDAQSASQLVRDIGPRVTVPTHFSQSELNYPVPQDGVDKITTELGSNSINEDKIKLKSGLPDSAQIITLNPSL